MAGVARIGQFSATDGQYGTPVPAAKPADNSITPSTTTPSQQTALDTQAQLDALYAQLKAASTTP